MVEVLADRALYEHTGGQAPDLEALEARYRAQVEGSPDQGETWCNWIARRIDDQAAIGFVQATVTGDAAEVAWLIGVDHQGQGFATEAARAMCEWLVGQGVSRVTAHSHPRHIASQRVALAIGLTVTGELDDEGEAIWASPPGW
jgi:RimJ/RimL family protein N-acetyltransferase